MKLVITYVYKYVLTSLYLIFFFYEQIKNILVIDLNIYSYSCKLLSTTLIIGIQYLVRKVNVLFPFFNIIEHC